MSRAHVPFLPLVLVSVLAGACGGSDGGGGATADAMPPMVVTHTAKGVDEGVHERVEEMLGGEAVLLKILGERLDPAGLAPPTDAEAYWQLQYVNPTTMMVVYVLSFNSMLNLSAPAPFDGDASLLIRGNWRDSSESLTKLAEAGFVAPPSGPPEYVLAMSLEQFVGSPDDPRSAVADPFWTIDKIHTPVGGSPTGETWQIAFVSAMNAWLACDLSTSSCAPLDP